MWRGGDHHAEAVFTVDPFKFGGFFGSCVAQQFCDFYRISLQSVRSWDEFIAASSLVGKALAAKSPELIAEKMASLADAPRSRRRRCFARRSNIASTAISRLFVGGPLIRIPPRMQMQVYPSGTIGCAFAPILALENRQLVPRLGLLGPLAKVSDAR
jgi:hypothetical protein